MWQRGRGGQFCVKFVWRHLWMPLWGKINLWKDSLNNNKHCVAHFYTILLLQKCVKIEIFSPLKISSSMVVNLCLRKLSTIVVCVIDTTTVPSSLYDSLSNSQKSYELCCVNLLKIVFKFFKLKKHLCVSMSSSKHSSLSNSRHNRSMFYSIQLFKLFIFLSTDIY